jgi:hypothetical protein
MKRLFLAAAFCFFGVLGLAMSACGLLLSGFVLYEDGLAQLNWLGPLVLGLTIGGVALLLARGYFHRWRESARDALKPPAK